MVDQLFDQVENGVKMGKFENLKKMDMKMGGKLRKSTTNTHNLPFRAKTLFYMHSYYYYIFFPNLILIFKRNNQQLIISQDLIKTKMITTAIYPTYLRNNTRKKKIY